MGLEYQAHYTASRCVIKIHIARDSEKGENAG